MDEFKSSATVEKEKKKAASKSGMLETMRSNYKPSAVDSDALLKAEHTLLYDVYADKNNKIVLSVYCTKCGKSFYHEMTERSVGELTCPTCGVSYNDRSAYSHTRTSVVNNVVLYENTRLPENDLLIRLFKVEKKYSVKSGYSERCWEQMRIFAGKKINVYSKGYRTSNPNATPFQKETIREIPACLSSRRYYYSDSVSVAQNEDTIREAIQNSCLKYSGLIEAYGLGDERYKAYKQAPDMSYLMTWYKNPSIELVLKSNLTQILPEIIDEPNKIQSGKTLAEVLTIEPAVAKMVVKSNCTMRELTDLSSLYNADNTLTLDLFNEIRRNNLFIPKLVSLKTNYGIDFEKTIKYMQAAYDHQCIEKRDALNLWEDYLRMAKALKIDLTDKSRLYPGSLKKEHDVAMFAYRSVQAEIDKTQFSEQAARNAFYEYTYKDLMVIVPKTPEEIVEEATRQKNCLRSYIERIKNGDTVVVFIRRKETPEFTYLTAEVCNGSLVQLKGYCNSNPRNKEINEFVAHWAKAKGIHVNC